MGRRDQEEEELQELLESIPDPSTIECFFCDSLGYKYVRADTLGIETTDERELRSVCRDCWPEEDEFSCEECDAGVFCPLHLTEDEWVAMRLSEFFAEEDEEMLE